MANSKQLVIPLTMGREIRIPMIQNSDLTWTATLSDSMVKDIELYFENGYYKLAEEKKIEIRNV